MTDLQSLASTSNPPSTASSNNSDAPSIKEPQPTHPQSNNNNHHRHSFMHDLHEYLITPVQEIKRRLSSPAIVLSPDIAPSSSPQDGHPASSSSSSPFAEQQPTSSSNSLSPNNQHHQLGAVEPLRSSTDSSTTSQNNKPPPPLSPRSSSPFLRGLFPNQQHTKHKPFYDLTPDFEDLFGGNPNSSSSSNSASSSGRRRQSNAGFLLDDDLFEGEDFLGGLILDESTMGMNGSGKFLDEYDLTFLARDLKDKHIGKELAELGFRNIVLQLDIDDVFVHRATMSDLSLIAESDLPIPKDSLQLITEDPEFNTSFYLVHKPSERFTVKTSNFLLDTFARRREVKVHDIKGYQDLLAAQNVGGVVPKSRSADENYGSCAATSNGSSYPTKHSYEDVSTTANKSDNTAATTTTSSTAAQLTADISHRSSLAPSFTPDTTPPTPLLSPSTPKSSFQTLLNPSDSTRLQTFLDTHFPPPPTNSYQSPHKASITVFEWTCMQNPLSTFTKSHPRFPGQNHPGLHIARKFLSHLSTLASKKHRDALVSVPEHLHNAWLYNLGGHRFINPAFEGYFRALVYPPSKEEEWFKEGGDLWGDMQRHGLAAVSWAFFHGHVKTKDGGLVEVWKPEEQYFPTSRRFQRYFFGEGGEYERVVKEFQKRWVGRVWIDWEGAKEIWKYSLLYVDREVEVEGGEHAVKA
ncbi:hypothetical protein HDV05_005249 [Chytridiales sp. JEL 0842]|nr:hypothetical protein HDV05_005249 [Chytridiales sp. JEL 0842]